MKIAAVHRRAILAHLCVEHHPHGGWLRTHRKCHADVADDRADDIALPSTLRIQIAPAASESDGRSVDGFLPQRAKALALKGRAFEADLAADEELFEPVVHGARQHHASEDVAPLVGRQRSRNAFARKKTVAGLEQLFSCFVQSLGRLDARRSVRQAGAVQPSQLDCERGTEAAGELLDRGRILARLTESPSLDRALHHRKGKRKTLDNEGHQASRDSGRHRDQGWPWHPVLMVAKFGDVRRMPVTMRVRMLNARHESEPGRQTRRTGDDPC